MKNSSWLSAGAIALAALLAVPMWADAQLQPPAVPQLGTINYVEGQVFVNGTALGEKDAGSARLGPGEMLNTDTGRAEVLLTPGVFLRLDNQSSVVMNSAAFENTTLTLNQGRAMIEATYLRPENNLRIAEHDVSTQILKPGLYDFNAMTGEIRVFDGKAAVEAFGKKIELKGGHEFNVMNSVKPKGEGFDKRASVDDFYRWSSLRSSYLADANAEAAQRYAAGSGYAPSLWYGSGWYWDPWFSAYTFIPADGIFYDPFGWGFYSPVYAPAFGFAYAPGYYRHFGPGYRGRQFANVVPNGNFIGRAHAVRPNGITAVPRAPATAFRGTVSPRTGNVGAMRSSGVFHGGSMRGGFAGGGARGGGGVHR